MPADWWRIKQKQSELDGWPHAAEPAKSDFSQSHTKRANRKTL